MDFPFPIKFVLPDSVPDFHVDLPDRSPVKRKMTRHWEWGIMCYLLVKTSMTETFDVLPDQGPVNFGYIFWVHSTEAGDFVHVES